MREEKWRSDLRRFADFLRKHSDERVMVYDYNADDIDAALARLDALTAERDALKAQVERVRVLVAELRRSRLAADKGGADAIERALEGK